MSDYKYALPVAFSGFETTIDVDVSFYIADATLGLWVLYDTDGQEIVGVAAPLNAATVRLTIEPALPEGEYKLVGLQ